MAARLTMFLCLEAMYWLPSVLAAEALRGKTKRPAWNLPNRIALCVFLAVWGTLPMIMAWRIGELLLLGGTERTLALCFGAGCLVMTLAVLWRKWRAPQIEHDEFKRLQKQERWRNLRRYGGLMLVILACGVTAYLWGRHSGLRAVSAAAAEAEQIMADLQAGGSPKALAQYQELFSRLDGDKELAAIQSRVADDASRWPVGEELSRLLAERQGLLREIENLAAGPPPALDGTMEVQAIPSFGVRQANLLLDLATLDAVGRADQEGAVRFLRLHEQIGGHLARIPTIHAQLLSGVICLPKPKVLADSLAAVPKAQKSLVGSYGRDLRSERQDVSARAANAVTGDAALSILSLKRLVTDEEADSCFKVHVTYRDFSSETYSLASYYEWFFLPVYGADEVPQVLREARSSAGVARGPFAQAKSSVEIMQVGKRSGYVGDFILGFGAERAAPAVVRWRASREQRLAIYETACALRLYALDTGKYPASLAELGPGYLAADVLNPAGPAQFSYQPEGEGFRLTWRSWDWQDGKLMPVGDAQEIAVGVAATPPDKLKKRSTK